MISKPIRNAKIDLALIVGVTIVWIQRDPIKIIAISTVNAIASRISRGSRRRSNAPPPKSTLSNLP